MKMKWGVIAGVLGGIAAAEAGGSAYFYRRTMMRYNAKKERDVYKRQHVHFHSMRDRISQLFWRRISMLMHQL